MKKSNVITAVILIIVLGLGGLKYYQYKHPSETTNVVKTINLTGNSTVETKTEPKSSLRVVTDPPINGTLKGVIEVGASGFNSFVVSIDKDKNWELVSKEFGQSLAYEGFANIEDVKVGMNKYFANIFEKGVSGRNVHFVMSSGALKNPKTELIAKGIESKGYVVNRVSAEQEGKLALKALLPKSYRDNSFVVDMGSGNTKISWYQNGNITSKEASGAKYYQDGKTDQDVYNEIKTVVSQVPADKRKNIFIIGGVPFKMASESRSGNERFTQLKNPDEYSAGDDVKYRSGLNIYRSLYENSGASTVIFDWDANFTIGFLLTLN